MARASLWTTAQKQRKEALAECRKEMILKLARAKFSYGEIEQIVRVNKGTAQRIVKMSELKTK